MTYIVEVLKDGERIGYLGEVSVTLTRPAAQGQHPMLNFVHTLVPDAGEALPHDDRVKATNIMGLYVDRAEPGVTFRVVEVE